MGAERILDAAEQLAAEGVSARAFAAVALGSYPAGLIGCRLSGSREWRKLGAGSAQYWQSKEAGLQVAVPGRGVLCLEIKGCHRLSRSRGVWYYGADTEGDPRR